MTNLRQCIPTCDFYAACTANKFISAPTYCELEENARHPTLQPALQAILDHIHTHGPANAATIAAALQVDTENTRERLSRLRGAGLIVNIGNQRRAIYALNPQETPMPPTAFVTFDLEIAATVATPAELDPAQDLGITIAAIDEGGDFPFTLIARDSNMAPLARWTAHHARQYLDRLETAIERGQLVVSWNGIHFDMQVLAITSGQPERCAHLARSAQHVDLCFACLCAAGYPVSLKAAAYYTAKPKGVAGLDNGIDAPTLWAAGVAQYAADRTLGIAKINLVRNYVAQDVISTRAVAEQAKRGSIVYHSKAGFKRHVTWPNWNARKNLHDLTVPCVMQWPMPNTAWMTQPIARTSFYDWTGDTA